MVERVAKAICQADGGSPEEVVHVRPGVTYRLWAEYEQKARAAIAAMREPTGEMVDAGAASYGVPTPAIGSLPLSVIDGQPTKAWRAMIDEALR